MNLDCIIFGLLIISINSFGLMLPPTGAEDGAIKEEANRFQGSLIFDKNGVPYYNYSYTGHNSIGIQGSPHAVSSHAMELYDQYLKSSNESAKAYFLNNVKWLAANELLKNNQSFSAYEFSFPWQIGNNTVEPPWRSAMANAEALNPLIKAYHLTGNNTYLNTAKRLLNSFYIDTKGGGLTYKSSNSGWWYEQYVSRNTTYEPRVLSGMMQALLAINDYYKDTNDASAKFLLDQGVLALKTNLFRYDNNGTSYFDDMGLPANSFYRSLHVMLLEKLYKLTDEPIFKFYHDRWVAHNLDVASQNPVK